MQLTQIQDEFIDAAHSQGQVDPNTFARLLLHDIDDVGAAVRELVERGLLERTAEGAFRLTTEGQAIHHALERAHSDAIKRNTRTWQRD